MEKKQNYGRHPDDSDCLLTAVLAYISRLSQTTKSSVLAFMEELSNHDLQNIQSELNRSWDELAMIYSRTQAGQCTTIQEVCRRLNLEQTTNTFDLVYLVDSNGNTYSGTNAVQEGRDEAYVQPLFAEDSRFVLRYDESFFLEATRGKPDFRHPIGFLLGQ